MAKKAVSKPDIDEQHAAYCREIELYTQKSQNFRMRGERIVKRYLDDRSESAIVSYSTKYNILWSNTQTLAPAVYAKCPVPVVERRYKDKDPVGRWGSEVMERSISYQMECGKFHDGTTQAVLDYLLPGRGIVWARYEPKIRPLQVAASEPAAQEDGTVAEEVYDEAVKFDYVNWHDVGHNQGRTWDEIWCLWRKVYLDRGELKSRFGKELGSKIPLDFNPNAKGSDQTQNVLDTNVGKACIYEIWDKKRMCAVWLSKSLPQILDEQDDPLKLQNFWPTPRPLYATLANRDLYPSAFFYEYQDQARELDNLTMRISALTKAIKIAGAYDVSAEGLSRLLQEGVENQLVPVQSWATLRDKGGLAGSFELWPVDTIAQTVLQLYQARDQVKQDLYEISGMPDVIRGSSDPNETATAQRLKGQFGSMRLRQMQDDVQRYCRDLIGICGEIVAQQFSLDTLKNVSGVQLLTHDQKMIMGQQIAMQQAQAQQPPAPGQPPAPPQKPQIPEGFPPNTLELMGEPTWEEVYELLRNGPARCFRIDIETDSTIGADDEMEKQQRMAFTQTASQLIAAASASVETMPELAPLSMDLIMFNLRAFKTGRTLEGEIETTLEALKKKLAASQGQPDKNAQAQQAKMASDAQLAQVKTQGELQVTQAKAQADVQIANIKAQNDIEVERMRQSFQAQQEGIAKQQQAQLKQMELQGQMELEKYKADQTMQLETYKANLQQQTQIRLAEIAAGAKVEAALVQGSADPTTADSYVQQAEADAGS